MLYTAIVALCLTLVALLMFVDHLRIKITKTILLFLYAWEDNHAHQRQSDRYIARLRAGHIVPPHMREPVEDEDEMEVAFVRWITESDLNVTPPEIDHLTGTWKIATGRRPASPERAAECRERLLNVGIPLAILGE